MVLEISEFDEKINVLFVHQLHTFGQFVEGLIAVAITINSLGIVRISDDPETYGVWPGLSKCLRSIRTYRHIHQRSNGGFYKGAAVYLPVRMKW